MRSCLSVDGTGYDVTGATLLRPLLQAPRPPPPRCHSPTDDSVLISRYVPYPAMNAASTRHNATQRGVARFRTTRQRMTP